MARHFQSQLAELMFGFSFLQPCNESSCFLEMLASFLPRHLCFPSAQTIKAGSSARSSDFKHLHENQLLSRVEELEGNRTRQDFLLRLVVLQHLHPAQENDSRVCLPQDKHALPMCPILHQWCHHTECTMFTPRPIPPALLAVNCHKRVFKVCAAGLT